MDIKKICDNIEDVIFKNVDISEGPEVLEDVLKKISVELFNRHSKTDKILFEINGEIYGTDDNWT